MDPMNSRVCMQTPAEFNAFPYNPPYQIQLQLMQHLYSVIEKRKLTIIESPTGTGKTLSLLCGTLTWLYDDRVRSRKGSLVNLRKSLTAGNEPDWVIEQSFERMKRDLEDGEREYEERLVELRKEGEALRKRSTARATKKRKLEGCSENLGSDEEFLPGPHKMGEGEGEARERRRSAHGTRDYPCLDGQPQSSAVSRTTQSTKIYYASRTHSQLSQVIQELRKLDLVSPTIAGGTNPNKDANGFLNGSHRPRTVALASRERLCINEELRRRTSDLDESCRDLLNGPVNQRCPFLPPVDENYRLLDLRDRILADPCDIEDLVLLGKGMSTCPYFASRAAIEPAELVTLPYNVLLSDRTRQIFGIELADQIIVIDEAHNLIDAILQLHSVELSIETVHTAIEQLRTYMQRFRTRLNAMHALNLKRLALFLSSLDACLAAQKHLLSSEAASDEKSVSVSAFVENLGSKINGLNLIELRNYLNTSKIARKAASYAKVMSNEGADVPIRSEHGAAGVPLHAVETFIACLANSTEDGVILVKREQDKEKMRIKYQHLNPASHFTEIVDKARCVALAGGTMSPISDLSLQLFPSMLEEDISFFACGHVIPRRNLQCLVIGKGPRNIDLQFKFKDRENIATLEELGSVLSNLTTIAPNGVVVFFPSYSFLEHVKSVWTRNGVLERLSARKRVFQEPAAGSEVDGILREYGQACRGTKGTIRGALLFAVVGAKLSEGLNFADDLARAVVVVGLPYPNLASPELRERMKHVANLAQTKKGAQTSPTTDAATELYENLCMKAVNQSIGRAIRHKNDWASLILIDSRYSSKKVRAKLPTWISEDLLIAGNFGEAVKALAQFYRAKKSSV